MTSPGSGYEQHLTNPLTTIRIKEKKYIYIYIKKNDQQKKQSKTKEFKHPVHHDTTPPPALTGASIR